MDRFSKHGLTEKRLTYQSALEFIGEIRGGISWERFCMHAVRNFDAFIDFLNDTDEAKEFLSLKHIDRPYVIENVKKILEKLHFNPENDYYLSLGLHHSASETQIHNRWKNLLLLYHPDRNLDSEDGSRAARKINEVYSVLKDAGKKLEYDRKLMRRTAGPAGVQGAPRRMSASRNNKRLERHDLLSPAMRKILPKIILPVSIVVSFFILLIIFWENKSSVDQRHSTISSSQATEVIKKTANDQADSGERKRTVDRMADRSDKPSKGKTEEQDGVSVQKSEKSVNKRTERTNVTKTEENLLTGQGDPKSFQTSGYSDEKRNRQNDQPLDKREMLQAQRPAIEKTDKPSGGEPPQAAGRQVKVSEPLQSDRREPQQSQKMARADESSDTPSRSPSHRIVAGDLESEVYLFLSIYINAYEKGSMQEFLSLFSKAAIEENGQHYDEMRRAYQKNFISKGYKYTVKNIQIREKGDTIIVNGVYHTEKMDGTEKAFKGDIRWILTREEGDFKIARVDYDSN
ncbi:MAG TPA: hypothetical protein DCP92_12425 [Nitrospiraceae bacterium]|nr:hypothetical protein [Nitrospiraceae bacterium]